MAFKMKYNKRNFPFKMTWEDRYGPRKKLEDDYGPRQKLGDLQRSGETRDEWQSRVNPKDYKVKTRKDDSKRKVVDKTGGNRKVTKYDKEGNVRKTVTWNGLRRTVEKPGNTSKNKGSKVGNFIRRLTGNKNKKELTETKKPTTPEDILSGNSSYTGKVSDWYRQRYTKPEWLKK